MKFSGYFLIVWDFIRYAKSSAAFPSGRAADRRPAAWSATRWRSPTSTRSQYGLLFERFLNPERISMPDIDIDFCTRRRGEVIQYVTEKYGREQVAQIITFGTLGRASRHQGCRPRARHELRAMWTASPSWSPPRSISS